MSALVQCALLILWYCTIVCVSVRYLNVMSALVQCALLILWYCTIVCVSVRYLNVMSALVQCALLILWYCTIVCVSVKCLSIVTLPLSVCFTKQLNNVVMSLRPGNRQWCLTKLCMKGFSTIHARNQFIFSMYIYSTVVGVRVSEHHTSMVYEKMCSTNRLTMSSPVTH